MAVKREERGGNQPGDRRFNADSQCIQEADGADSQDRRGYTNSRQTGARDPGPREHHQVISRRVRIGRERPGENARNRPSLRRFGVSARQPNAGNIHLGMGNAFGGQIPESQIAARHQSKTNQEMGESAPAIRSVQYAGSICWSGMFQGTRWNFRRAAESR